MRFLYNFLFLDEGIRNDFCLLYSKKNKNKCKGKDKYQYFDNKKCEKWKNVQFMHLNLKVCIVVQIHYNDPDMLNQATSVKIEPDLILKCVEKSILN